MKSLVFILNDTVREEEVNPSMTVLDYLRYQKGLVGTKIGCREGDCGACTVLLGGIHDGQLQYRNITSCLTPMGNIHGKHLISIEGLNMEDLSTVQQALVDTGGTQCGFCTVGFIVSLTGACLNFNDPSFSSLIDSIDGNICRCTGYKSIERAIEYLEKELSELTANNWIETLVHKGFLPEYFKSIEKQLKDLDIPALEFDSDMFVSGGTDLYVQRYDDLIELDVNLVNHSSDDYIIEDDEFIRVGANTVASKFAESAIIKKYIPNIEKFFKLIASQPIRNLATFAGNIVNASPIADFVNILLALDASVVLQHRGETRELKLDQMYIDYKVLAKKDDEQIREIYFPIPKNKLLNFEKVSKRTHLDIASVNSSIVISAKEGTIQHCRIAAGGVAPYPLYLGKTSTFLRDKEISYEVIKEAIAIVDSEIAPISDIRGSEQYKRLLLRQLIIAHFTELYPNRIKEFRRIVV